MMSQVHRSYDQVIHACDHGLTAGLAETDGIIIDGWVITRTVAVTITIQKVEPRDVDDNAHA